MANAAVIPDLFTVVLTVFERESLLPYALQSLAWQRHQNLEILIYTDGPSPRARAIVDSLASNSQLANKLRYTELLRTPGYWGNHLRAKGMEEARGEFLAFLSHDTVYHPDFCSHHAAAMTQKPCVSVAPVDYWLVSERSKDPVYVGVQPVQSPVAANLGQIDAHCVSYPTEYLRRYASFDGVMEIHGADFHIFDQMRKRLPVVFNDQVGTLAAHM